eukprot:INCI10200.3.p1 GENE.INCI10200.3~~INCI10200.3.p1  ORF type:complete len:535 (-),score=133.26 INCI10200.3:58-1662(-)
MTSTTQVFAVPVARDDYCERDTLEMALDALQVLDRTCNEVFTRVEQKIDEASSKLMTANERIEAARFRVKKITGVSSATTIFSKPTYPTGPECSTYEPVLGGLGFTDVAEPFEEDEEAPPFEVEGKGPGSNPAELRQLYKSVNPDLSFTELGQKPGLGRLPKRLPSVSSMLLFNSTATPYKQYSTINTLLGEDFASREEDDDNYEMEHAPDTFMNDQDDNGVQTVDFGFVPAAVELDMSSLNFMDNLSLPGIADNVNYQSAPEGLHSFAPSILKNEQGAGFLALEDLSMPGIDPGPGGMPPPAATTTAAAPPPPPQGGAAAASPPPPPGTYYAPAPAPAAAAAAPPPPPGGGMPPPPGGGMPPPPPGGMPPPPGGMPPPPGGMPPPPGGMPPPPGGMPPPPGGNAAPAGPPVPAAVPFKPPPDDDVGGGGGDLLAAIRAGKKLKSSKKKAPVKQKPKPKKKASLGDDLAATLARRAQSMRGEVGKPKKKAAPKKAAASALPDLGSSSEDEGPAGMAALDDTDEEEDSSEEWSED